MYFYLNQKSLPMIRKCGSCRHFNKEFESCGLRFVTNAYEHTKKIFLTTGENLYCDKHEFKNEEVLKREAVVVEFKDVGEAMQYIERSKETKNKRGELLNKKP